MIAAPVAAPPIQQPPPSPSITVAPTPPSEPDVRAQNDVPIAVKHLGYCLTSSATTTPSYSSDDGGKSALAMMKDCHEEVAEYCQFAPNSIIGQKILKSLDR